MKIIKNGTLVTGNGKIRADLLINGEKIEAIGLNFNEEKCEVIDASGMLIFPGAVDAHTHFELDVGRNIVSVDDFTQGSISAACGGVTTIIDHMAFGPVGCDLTHQPKIYHKKADNKTFIDYSFHGTIQHVDDKILSQMQDLIDEGITSFKLYTTYGFKISEADILKVFKRAKELNAVIAIHCEDDAMINHKKSELNASNKFAVKYHPISRPDICEEASVENMISLAKLVDGVKIYIVHLSTKAGLDDLIQARKQGLKNIFIETCSQYLSLDDSLYEGDGALKYTMSPPLRKQKDIDALWQGLKNGYIDVIATDHCPFNLAVEKQIGKDDYRLCPGGAPGVEERFRVVYTEGVCKGKISLETFVKTMCENPAKIYGVPNKGKLEPNYDADIIIYDPNVDDYIRHSDLHGNVDYSIYEGFKVKGKIKKVFLRGELIVSDNKFLHEIPNGKFIKRTINSF
ncbi:dihydropyrimidinase [Campylobacter sp. MG1]|uniref:dihydropyrimidinase n=1 Tax=Campylobacter sp. MG1 TaxID=2976332 RepID=UPI00226D3008|nr:dihydropyrimidinase [Campylobacter sp. MG1]